MSFPQPVNAENLITQYLRIEQEENQRTWLNTLNSAEKRVMNTYFNKERRENVFASYTAAKIESESALETFMEDLPLSDKTWLNEKIEEERRQMLGTFALAHTPVQHQPIVKSKKDRALENVESWYKTHISDATMIVANNDNYDKTDTKYVAKEEVLLRLEAAALELKGIVDLSHKVAQSFAENVVAIFTEKRIHRSISPTCSFVVIEETLVGMEEDWYTPLAIQSVQYDELQSDLLARKTVTGPMIFLIQQTCALLISAMNGREKTPSDSSLVSKQELIAKAQILSSLSSKIFTKLKEDTESVRRSGGLHEASSMKMERNSGFLTLADRKRDEPSDQSNGTTFNSTDNIKAKASLAAIELKHGKATSEAITKAPWKEGTSLMGALHNHMFTVKEMKRKYEEATALIDGHRDFDLVYSMPQRFADTREAIQSDMPNWSHKHSLQYISAEVFVSSLPSKILYDRRLSLHTLLPHLGNLVG